MEKKYIKYLILSLIIVVICIGALNYIVDPLMYYQRYQRVFPVLYTEDPRYLIPGLIKNSKGHNAVIIGSSMVENFLPSQVHELFNEKTIKLSINGATLLEQSYVLSHYLDAHPNSKIIIWGMDTVSIDKDSENITTQEYSYPFFLYDDSTINLQYLLNYEVTVHSFQTIANNLLGIGFLMKTRDLDQINTWPGNTQTGCKKVFEHYRDTSRRYSDVLVQNFNNKNAIANLKRIVDLAERRRDVQFYFFLTPYSIVRYIYEVEHNGLERLLQARNFFAYKTKEISNIKIIDLQASEDIISNLDYYKDMNHYNRTIKNTILKNIVDGNFDGYESILENTEKLRALIGKYDFEKLKKCEFQL